MWDSGGHRLTIEMINGLLFVPVRVTFRGNSRTIEHVVMDTGASHSVLSMAMVEDIGIYGDVDRPSTTRSDRTGMWRARDRPSDTSLIDEPSSKHHHKGIDRRKPVHNHPLYPLFTI